MGGSVRSSFTERRGSFRAIFPRGSRFRSGCKLAAWRRSEICKSGEKHVARGRNKIEAKETEFLEFLSPFFSSFPRRSIVLGIFGRRNNHYKTFGRDRDGLQNGLRIMDPCIFIDTLKNTIARSFLRRNVVVKFVKD